MIRKRSPTRRQIWPRFGIAEGIVWIGRRNVMARLRQSIGVRNWRHGTRIGCSRARLHRWKAHCDAPCQLLAKLTASCSVRFSSLARLIVRSRPGLRELARDLPFGSFGTTLDPCDPDLFLLLSSLPFLPCLRMQPVLRLRLATRRKPSRQTSSVFFACSGNSRQKGISSDMTSKSTGSTAICSGLNCNSASMPLISTYPSPRASS